MLFFCWFDVGSVLLWCCFLVESLLFPCWQNVVLLLVLPSKWHFCRMARYAFVVQTHLVRKTLRPLLKPSLEYASAISFAAGAALERRRQIVTKKQCHGGTKKKVPFLAPVSLYHLFFDLYVEFSLIP